MKPTVGRIVHYWPTGKGLNAEGPQAAVVSFVHKDGTMNVGVFNKYGTHQGGKQRVELVQGDITPAPGVHFCEWPPREPDVIAVGPSQPPPPPPPPVDNAHVAEGCEQFDEPETTPAPKEKSSPKKK